jgi:peptidoglycan/LPS O-acetylase OafA/YrhL
VGEARSPSPSTIALRPGSSRPPAAGGARIAGIEGLRAIAATSILVYHTWEFSGRGEQAVWLGPGTRLMNELRLGVTLFFALSGFLLYRQFAARLLEQAELPSIGRYVRSRVLRIMPAYLTVLLFAALLLGSAFVSDSSKGVEQHGSLPHPIMLAQDALLIQNWHPSTMMSGLPPAWSLAIEAAFYLTLPLAALAAVPLVRRAGSRRGKLLAVLAPPTLLVGLGLLGKLAAATVVTGPEPSFAGTWHGVIDRSFPAHADLFGYGMLVAVAHVVASQSPDRRRVLWRGPATVLLALVGLYLMLWDAGGGAPYLSWDALTGLVCAGLLAITLLPSGGRRHAPWVWVLERRPMVWLGTVSYSLFLWNYPIIFWMGDRHLLLVGPAGFAVNLVTVGGACLLLSAASYRWIEAPAMRLARRRSPSVQLDAGSSGPSASSW